ncbi:MAG: hypothetical protein OK456_10350 [Thaumarchaeota archaeon]|nr:hypothetical protein [Nitrososphaerota archaeon]
MRRLLSFGAGAAIIGTLLLIAAFYETYVVVNSLQTHLNTAISSTSNNLLEDSSVEAVFLGIMAILGYILIAQGLEGIRKQELVDLQKTNMRMTAPLPRARPIPKVPAQKPAGWHPPVSASQVTATVASTTASAETAAQAPAKESRSRFSLLFGSKSESPDSKSSELPPSTTSSNQDQSVHPTETETSIAPPAETPSSQVVEPTSPTQFAQLSKGPGPVVPESVVEAATAASASDSSSGTVAWEGGGPPNLEGVEVVPEAPSPTQESASDMSGTSQGHSPTDVPSETPAGTDAPPKRRRGRPKGTKKKAEPEPEPTSPAENNEQPSV